MPDLHRLLGSLGLEGAFEPAERLGCGPISDSWRVLGPDGPLVLRKDRLLAHSLGLDREAEWAHLKIAYAADLGPEPLARDIERGLLVTRFLAGTPWSERPETDWAAHGELMRRVHQAPAREGKVFDPVGVARAYRRGTAAPHAGEWLNRVISLASGLEPEAERCLCHHDAHRGNVIGSSPTRLIDWEYAAHGDPLFDLAVVSRFHGLGSEQNKNLLSGWGLATADPARFRANCELYDALATLWQLAVNEGANRRSH